MGKLKKTAEKILYFFPVQIIITHLRKNQILLLFWAVLFSILTNGFGSNVGLPYLLLDPEYLGQVSFLSMFIMGSAYGIYTIAFFLTSYILDAHKFPFLATVKYPLLRFSVNNSLIPLVFLSLYLIKFYNFQLESSFQSTAKTIKESIGFFSGFSLILTLLFLYLTFAQNRFFKTMVDSLDFTLKKKRINTVRVIKKMNEAQKNKFVIRSYLYNFWKIKKVDATAIFLNKEAILKIIDRHHLNATIVQIGLFLLIIGIGVFKEYSLLQIPAAASGFLLFSFFVMFTGAFAYWFRNWTITGIIAILLIFNFFMKRDFLDSPYQAFGLSYDEVNTPYNLDEIEKQNSKSQYDSDKKNTLEILNNWRKQFPKAKKPKIIFLATSGGGQRAALWTTHTLQYIDKALDNKLMRHTKLITGASGGLIGAAYYRELYLRKINKKLETINDNKYSYNIAKDLLNPMIFSIVVNDLFFRYKKFEYEGNQYFSGRGYTFEKTLNKNTNNILNKKVSDYTSDEFTAKIPMLLISPTIINDGRRLYISTQPISYMNNVSHKENRTFVPRQKGIDFNTFFKEKGAKKLKLLSALRMNASFPYISPFVELPTEPKIEVMDAGLSDNYGISDALRFMTTFENWIKENTSGVIIVSIRDSETDPEVEKPDAPSLFKNLFNPIGTIFNHWEYIQDFSNDNQIEYVSKLFKNKFNVISFCYDPKPHNWRKLKEKDIDPDRMEKLNQQSKASLSWHLTIREKESIMRTIEEDYNQEMLNNLKNLLNE